MLGLISIYCLREYYRLSQLQNKEIKTNLLKINNTVIKKMKFI